MPIGLYFGSFNPIHIGHLIIASHVLNEAALKKIWFVISPQNPFKKSAALLNEFDRLHLVQKAIAEDPRLKAVDIEFSLPKPSFTATTLAYLNEKPLQLHHGRFDAAGVACVRTGFSGSCGVGRAKPRRQFEPQV